MASVCFYEHDQITFLSHYPVITSHDYVHYIAETSSNRGKKKSKLNSFDFVHFIIPLDNYALGIK